MIDGGAHTGDSAYDFIKHTGGKFDRIYMFEPDYKNYLRLNDNLDRFPYRERLEAVDKAISDFSGTVRFSDSKGAGSHVSENGSELVNAVSLDDYALGKNITFVKLDIEGHEKQALNGAYKLISTYKPKLAVCIYHEPNDIWEIPRLIKNINPDYKLYIRHKRLVDIFDTVCYAI